MDCLKLQYGVEADNEEPGHYIPRGFCALACMVNSEIGAVLAVVRRNVRWGGRYMAGNDQLEHSLVQSLKTLRGQIFFWDNQWQTVDPCVYLQPFLDVIRSDEIGALITGVALNFSCTQNTNPWHPGSKHCECRTGNAFCSRCCDLVAKLRSQTLHQK